MISAMIAAVMAPAPTPTLSGDPGGGGVCSLPVIGAVCGTVGGVVSGVASSAAQTFVDGFADGFSTLVKTVLTFWVSVPTPTLSGAGGTVAHLNGLVYWMQGVVLIGSLLYVAGKMMLDRTGKAAGDGLRGLVSMVVFTGAGAAGIDILTTAGDHWSQWIIQQSSNGSMAERLLALTGGHTTLATLGLGLEFIVSLFGILSCLGQIFFLLARVGILTVLTGTLPLAAAGAGTPAGKAWLQRILAWDLAFVLYKPAAALVYAGGFQLAGTGKDLTSILSGLMLIILAIFALPALMRLIMPMVAAASSGGGGALTGAVAGAVLASGARQIGPSSSGGGSGGGRQPGLSASSPGGAGNSSAAAAPSGAGSAGSSDPSPAATGSAASSGAGAQASGAAAAGGPAGVAVAAAAQSASAASGAAKSAANNATGGA